MVECEPFGDLGRVRPQDQPGLRQAPPRELRARVLLASRRDVGVAEHAIGRYPVACHDVPDQGDDRLDLLLRVGRIYPSLRRVGVAGIDDLDPDRAGIEHRVPVPVAVAGVAGQA